MADPKPKTVQPNSGYQGDTTHVTILGENFEDSPKVMLLFKNDYFVFGAKSHSRGDASDKIVVKSKTIDPYELKCEFEVANDAVATTYVVRVCNDEDHNECGAAEDTFTVIESSD